MAGKIKIINLNSPVASYSFKIKARNPSDTGNQPSSESDFSLAGAIINVAPTININSVSQQINNNFVNISYTGIDPQSDTNSLIKYEYSTDGSTWQTMTEKTGIGSEGISSLSFTAAGQIHQFAWDAAADLPSGEYPTARIRLQSFDGLASSNIAVSSAFAIDTLGPSVSNISTSQTPGSGNLTISYNLADSSAANVYISLMISADGGATWNVATSTVSGDVGVGVSVGTDRQINWQAKLDFNNQEQGDMKIKIAATDQYGNAGNFTESTLFNVDTKAPTISLLTAEQSKGSNLVTANYTLNDLTVGGNIVEFQISDDGGTTWTVATTTFSGAIGGGQTTGAKTFSWNANIDFAGQEQNDMRLRVRALDYFGNQGSYAQSNIFSLDTKAPQLSGLTVNQSLGSDLFTIIYNLTENSGTSTVSLEISADGGITWNVGTSGASGAIGGNLSSGSGKIITWDAAQNYLNQENSLMRVRVRGQDTYSNISNYLESGNFALDTGVPLGLNSFSKVTSTTTSATLTWSTGITDANFNHYELWHGANQTDVQNTTGTAQKWSVGNDPLLNNINTLTTVITGLNITGDYYIKILAVDDYGNAATLPAINVYQAPVIPAPTVTTGGGAGPALAVLDTTPPIIPILNTLNSYVNTQAITISGLTEPQVKVNLYDNGVLLSQSPLTSDNNGRFSQRYNLTEGLHVVTATAVDLAGNTSAISNPINVTIDLTPQAAPTILSPQNNGTISSAAPTIYGLAEPSSIISISAGTARYQTTADNAGGWSFTIPNVITLPLGAQNFNFIATDQAGNSSAARQITLVRAAAAAAASTVLTTAGQAVTTPLPSAQIIRETSEAVEIAGIAPPVITAVAAATTADTFRFSGTALPNQDVIVYIHSDQAVIYRVKTDAYGNWTVNHSQDLVELAPGDHTIYAVTLDSGAKIKSRPSITSGFVVKRNIWVVLYRILNLPTTIIAIIMLLSAILWLQYTKRKTLAA